MSTKRQPPAPPLQDPPRSMPVRYHRVETRQIKLTGAHILQFLTGKMKPAEIPDGIPVKIYVRVPGGGDWSNMDLEIEGDQHLIVEWTIETDDPD